MNTEVFWSLFEQAYYAPLIGSILILWAQLDLLASIIRGGKVNIKARLWDLIHWLLLISINVSTWIHGVVTPWWFILQLLMLGIIGAQIGAASGDTVFLRKEKLAIYICALSAIILGINTGLFRARHDAVLGLGWWFETVSATVATAIVLKWVLADLNLIQTAASGYPRSFFVKGILSNLLFVWFLLFSLDIRHFSAESLLANLGLVINVVVGNLIYLCYYICYEYCRHYERLRHAAI